MIQVAIMGFGTIGSGVAEILEQNSQQIQKATGEDVVLKYILDLRDFPDSPFADKIVHDFSIIEQDPEVQVVVEAMGGVNPAYPFTKACLQAGKHVATPNKALVAAHGTELLAVAREKNVNFFFEASVGGGIPIIRPMYRCLMGEKIQEITGILNGTTNYILTRMDREGASFADVLKDAQALGYAEQNPEADVEGHDACRKIAILTAMATGHTVDFKEIYTEGITAITDRDFAYANKLGTSIKLFASSQLDGDTVHAWVAPVMINKEHPLYSVNDVYNGIVVKGNMLGTTMYYGSGAGKLPTASAVVADMIEIVQNKNKNVDMGWDDQVLSIASVETSSHGHFFRISGAMDLTLEATKQVFGVVDTVTVGGADEYAVLTKTMTEGEFRKKKEELSKLLMEKGQKILQMIRTQL